ncbi:Arm DNA-binding domain-containing protein, partial [Escherichia coli]|uniref:Arm DNA-binding domain-containing protein n=1 Tax=Escherichia coli TaxID=562 RepID=UPI00202EB534
MSKLPTGVEIRGRNIRIWFMFRGKRCRETLKGWEITNSNIKKAGNLRALIVHEINSGEFEYLRRFPQSSTGAKMVTTRVIKTFGELCDIWTKIKETVNRPGFPGECFICELRLPDHRFRWK